MKRAANIQQNVKTAESLTFGRILAAPQPLSKFNTCSWHSACTIFGGSDIFATLSLSLSHSSDKGLYRSETRGRPRQYKAFHAEMYGKPVRFLSSSVNF